MEPTETVGSMWSAFLAARPELAGPETSYTAWHFCDNESDADELAALVLSGRKRATAGAVWSYELEGEPVPKAGDFSVVTYWDGSACCVIRTTAIDVVRFDEVDEEFAATEGEGDGSLDFWRRVHWAAYGREFAGTDRVLAPDIPVACERFEVVFPIGAGTRD